MQAPSHRLRTLIVEADPDSARQTRRALDRTGCFEVVGQAVDAHDAHLLAQTFQPDVVLLDVNIPGADGFSALPYIQDAAPHSRIIMLSDAQPESTRRRAAALRIDCLPRDTPIVTYEVLGRSLLRDTVRT